MKLSSNLYLTLCAFGLAGRSSTPANADSLTGDQRGSILLELNDIQDVLDGKQLNLRTSAAQTFQAASASNDAAYEFYLKCHKLLNFDPKGASYSDFRDWRDRQEDKVKTEPNLAAMRLQLQYLVLSMKAAEADEIDAIIPELEQFVGNVVANAENLNMRTMQEPVTKTIFAEAYELNKSLKMENWSYSPGNYNEVYQKTILPFFRDTAPEELAAAWDRRINLESGLVASQQAGNTEALEKFQQERLPTLHWQKSMDLFNSVSQKQGAAALIQLVRANPEHPNIRNWVENFRRLLLETTTSASDEYTEPAPQTPQPVDPNNPLGFE